MKTKSEAVKALLAAGWTLADVKSVLGDLPKSELPNHQSSSVPWWTWIREAWYPIDPMSVDDWEAVSQP